jgi:hypothetical protein
MMSLGISYGWSAYLYLDSGITFLNWEGDILDFFWSEERLALPIQKVFASHESRRIPPPNTDV